MVASIGPERTGAVYVMSSRIAKESVMDSRFPVGRALGDGLS